MMEYDVMSINIVTTKVEATAVKILTRIVLE